MNTNISLYGRRCSHFAYIQREVRLAFRDNVHKTADTCQKQPWHKPTSAVFGRQELTDGRVRNQTPVSVAIKGVSPRYIGDEHAY